MAVDVSTLALEVKSTGVAEASKQLDDLGKKSSSAESASNKLLTALSNLNEYLKVVGATTNNLSSSLNSLNAYLKAAADAQAKHTAFLKTAIEAQAEMVRQLKSHGDESTNAKKKTEELTAATSELSVMARKAAELFAAWKIAEFVKDIALLAARYETLGVVMQVVGNNSGYTGAQMAEFQKGLQKTGISAVEARQGLVLMGQAQVDMAKSAQLARVAQDAAVIANTNSSEAFNRMMTGISTGQSIILHHMGLMTNFEKGERELAASLGKTKEELTAQELTQARVNEVMRVSVGIAGSYEAAMGTTGKALSSIKRFADDTKVALGDAFGPALTTLVDELTRALKDAKEQLESNKSSTKTFGSDLNTLISGSLNKFKTDLSQINAFLFDMASGLYLLAAVAETPGRIFGDDLYNKTLRQSNAYADLAAKARAYAEAAQAAAAVSGPILDPSEQGRANAMKDEAENRRIAEGNKRRQEEADAARKAANEKAAEEARELAEKQAQYEKQLLDAEASLKQQYAANQKHREESDLKERLAQLTAEKDAGLKTAQEYLDEKYSLELATAKKEAELAGNQAHERYLAYAKVSDDPGADRLLQVQAEQKWAEAVGKSAAAQQHLNAVIAQKPRDDDQIRRDQAHFAAEMNIQRLQIQGYKLEAEAAANQLKYADMSKRGYTSEQIELQKRNDKLKTAIDLYEKQIAVRNELKDLEMANAEKAASLSGVNPGTGTITSIADQATHDLDVQQAAYQKEIEMIERKRNAAIDAYNKSSKAAEDYMLLQGKMAAADNAIGLAQRDNAYKTSKIIHEAYAAQTAIVVNYTKYASDLFGALASAQDQSSRKGFETAKALGIASAVVNTAAAVMNALATVQPYPLAIAAAASAAATGAVQIAKISSTSFGGGGSAASVPSGSFGGGAGGGNSTGSAIGAPVRSMEETQTEDSLRRLAASAESASLAVNRVANGLTKISDLFTSGYSKNISAGMGSTAPGSSGSPFVRNSVDGIVGPTKAMALGMDPIAASTIGTVQALGGMAFGWGNPWYIKDRGLVLGQTGGVLSGVDYASTQQDGGWLTGDKKKTYTKDINDGMHSVLNDYMDQIKGAISTAAVALGTTTDFSKAAQVVGVVSTAGKTPEQIQAQLETFFTNTSNSLAKTTQGLQEFTFNGETAFNALIRLSTSLQGVNELFELTGKALISSSLAGGNAAYKLADAFGGLDKMSDKVGKYFESMFTTQQQEAMKAAQEQRQVNTAFAEMGQTVPKSKAEFIALVNSIDVTTKSGAELYKALMEISPAFADIIDHAEKMKQLQDDLNKSVQVRYLQATGQDNAATILNLQIQQANELREAQEKGLDTTQLVITQQAELAQAQKKIADAALQAAKALEEKSNNLNIEIMQLSGDTAGATALKRKMELAAMDESLRPLQERIYALQDEAAATQAATDAANKAKEAAKQNTATAMAILQKSVQAAKDAAQAEYNAKVDQINAAKEAQAAAYQVQEQAAQDHVSKISAVASTLKSAYDSLASPQAETLMSRQLAERQIHGYVTSGRLPMNGELDGALKSVTQPSESLFSSYTDYRRDAIKTANDLKILSNRASAQQTDAERQLKALQDANDLAQKAFADQEKAAKDQLDAQNKALDATLQMAQEQVDAINGTTIAVLAIPDAINNLAEMLRAQMAAEGVISVPNPGGIDIAKQPTSGNPWLYNAPTSAVRPVSASDNYTAELLVEMQAMRTELTQLRSEVTTMRKDTRRSADLIEVVTEGGNAMRTVAA